MKLGMARSPEHDIQRAYFDWARLDGEARCAFAIPNGGHRHIVTAAKLKAEGVRAGVLDVCLPKMRGGCGGLYIEFKAGSNTLSEEQLSESHRLVSDGYAVAVCWDAVMAVDFTREYLAGRVGPSFTVLKPARKRSAGSARSKPSSRPAA